MDVWWMCTSLWLIRSIGEKVGRLRNLLAKCSVNLLIEDPRIIFSRCVSDDWIREAGNVTGGALEK